MQTSKQVVTGLIREALRCVTIFSLSCEKLKTQNRKLSHLSPVIHIHLFSVLHLSSLSVLPCVLFCCPSVWLFVDLSLTLSSHVVFLCLFFYVIPSHVCPSCPIALVQRDSFLSVICPVCLSFRMYLHMLYSCLFLFLFTLVKVVYLLSLSFNRSSAEWQPKL